MEQAYLFNQGQDYYCYKFLGAHPFVSDQTKGFVFSVWAPNAISVSVIGDFNDWDPYQSPMTRLGATGIWQCNIPSASVWDRYKYFIKGADGNFYEKIDPCARHCETRPANASIVYYSEAHVWQDQNYVHSRTDARANKPMNIYELHLGSWRKNPAGDFLNYRHLAHDLALYCKDLGYNYVEIMPIMEHPLDDSWGYQVTGFFAVTSRFGTPDDFKYFVDFLHQNNIGVILDWVPGHFPKNSEGLARFDGSPCYEYADSRLGEHMEWGTYVFDYSKKEIQSFLCSNLVYWIEEYHVDGIRVDAVSSMLYRNYGRKDYLPNDEGGVENKEAVFFLQSVNRLVQEKFPWFMMIAEESTAWPKVSHPIFEGGVGFSHKWNMGWMHDSLDYFMIDYYARRYHHDQFCFSMEYAFAENYILSLSHDEVVHGKKSLLDKMPGDQWRKFASLRVLFMYMMAHPGSKLTFMGSEFGQYTEWRFFEELEWFLLDYEIHKQLHCFMKTINHCYLDTAAFWEVNNWSGFQWIQNQDKDNQVFIFCRYPEDHTKGIMVILNMTPVPLEDYTLYFDRSFALRLLLNSDEAGFGGSNYLYQETDKHKNCGYQSSVIPQTQFLNINGASDSKTENEMYPFKVLHQEEASFEVKFTIPPLAGLYYEIEIN